MNSSFKILIILYFLTQIYGSAKIVTQEVFDSLYKEKSCKGIKYGKCLDFLDEILLFKNALENNSLHQEKIYINEISKTPNSKHTYQINKNGITYYLPSYILEKKSSKSININQEHTISIGDEILVYHLFNKVFFAELIETPIPESEPIVYDSPKANGKGRYNMVFTESNWPIIKEIMGRKLPPDFNFDKFKKALYEIEKQDLYHCLLKIALIWTDESIEIKDLSIGKASTYLRNSDNLKNKKIENIYRKDGPLYYQRSSRNFKEKNKIDSACLESHSLWADQMSDTIPAVGLNIAKILEILTYWINLDSKSISKGQITNHEEVFIIKLYEG